MDEFTQVLLVIALLVILGIIIFNLITWHLSRRNRMLELRHHEAMLGLRRRTNRFAGGRPHIPLERDRFEEMDRVMNMIYERDFNAIKNSISTLNKVTKIEITEKNNKIYYDGEEILNPEMLGRRIYQKIKKTESDKPISSINDIT